MTVPDTRDLVLDTLLRTDDIELRHRVRAEVVASINRALPGLSCLAPTDDRKALAALLHHDGIQPAGRTDPALCEGILRHISQMPLFNSYSAASSDGVARLPDQARKFPIGAVPTQEVCRTPGVVEIANDPNVLKIVECYLGCIPTIYSIGIWHSFPCENYNITQTFHRDYDDFRFCSLFVYLTDVDEQSGPHQYVKQSHTLDGVRDILARWASRRASNAGGADLPATVPEFYFQMRFTEKYNVGGAFHRSFAGLFGDQVVDVMGPAGTSFLADIYGLHRGLHPRGKPRTILNVRYGIGAGSFGPRHGHAVPHIDPETFRSRLPSSPTVEYINRNFLR